MATCLTSDVKLVKIIRKRQMEFLGHVMGKRDIEKLIVVTGKIVGRKDCGRQRLTYVNSPVN